MAEITTKRQGEMIQTLFHILKEEPEGIRAKDAIARLEDEMELSDFERSYFPNNPDSVRFPKIVRFSTINSVKAGWLRKKGGIWTLTEDGEEALGKFPNPEQLFRESRRLYREWKASQPEPEEGAETRGAEHAGDEGLLAATTLEEAEEGARKQIFDYLATVNPYEFQDLVAKLLEGMGYNIVWIAPKGKDGGLDLLAQRDPLGIEGPLTRRIHRRRSGPRSSNLASGHAHRWGRAVRSLGRALRPNRR